MKKLILFATLALVLAYAGLHHYTQPKLRASAVTAVAALPKGDPTRGRRLATIAGCISCHGDDLGGEALIAQDYVFRLVAPDLTRVREGYDDADFVRLFRTGGKVDGNLALGMPTLMQQRMTDREVADIIAFIRSVPASAQPVQEETRIYPLARIGILAGKYHPYEGDRPESDEVLLDRKERNRGRHLAQIACTHCHGAELEGNPKVGAPALALSKAYSLAQFRTLLRTGTTMAGTQSTSGLMSEVSRSRFHVLTDGEIRDLHRFLSGDSDSERPTIVRTPTAEIGAADEMMTPEELEAWKKKNAESMKALEHVPELQR